ncbi:MAG: hypothetical protein M3364_04540 [Actinomycetota bacterium]|nr:hypothetical protein [Actinomycetota bacterium]
MSVINKRNAILGYATLKVLQRRRKQRLSASKISLYLGLGLVAAGVLAGLVALLVRRHRSEPDQRDVDTVAEEKSESVEEQIAASPEPLPAT